MMLLAAKIRKTSTVFVFFHYNVQMITHNTFVLTNICLIDHTNFIFPIVSSFTVWIPLFWQLNADGRK